MAASRKQSAQEKAAGNKNSARRVAIRKQLAASGMFTATCALLRFIELMDFSEEARLKCGFAIRDLQAMALNQAERLSRQGDEDCT